MNGIFYELIPLSKATQFQRLSGTVLQSASSHDRQRYQPNRVVPGHSSDRAWARIVCPGGWFLYWWSNIVAFDKENLPVQAASVLAQGETITVI